MNTELNLLATALQNQEAYNRLLEIDIDYFTHTDSKLIYQSIIDLYNDNVRADYSAVLAKIEESGKELSNNVISELVTIQPTYNFTALINSLIKRYNDRLQKDLAKDLYKAEGESEIESILKRFEEIRTVTDDSINTKDLAMTNIDEVFSKSYFTKTSIDSLDDILIGLFDGQLITVAGRPGEGKTTLALQLCLNINYPKMLFSGEMSRVELYGKLLSSQAEVESWKIEAKRMDESEMKRVFHAHDEFKKHSNIKIYDGRFSFRNIKNTIKKEAKRQKLFIIDYLQIISGGQGNTEDLRLSSITRELKELAREIKKPIIMLSQLNRESEKQDREPVKSDLRGSGAIEQDSDVIIFTHKGYLILAKNRKGKTGSIINIRFIKEYSKWISL
jgi:replicative DNA helicase